MADGADTTAPGLTRRSGSEHPPFAVVVTPLRARAGLRPLIRALAGQTGLGDRCTTVFAAVGDRLAAAATAFEVVGNGALELRLFEGEPAPDPAADCRKVLEAASYHLQRYAGDADPVMLLIDAEAIPAADWIACNLRALDGGAEIVCGNPVPSLRRAAGVQVQASVAEALSRYRRLAARLEEFVDPVEWDPAPRHGDESGASLAFRLSTLMSAGGVPHVPGDLRAHLIARLRQSGGVVRHCSRSRVFVPPRLLAGLDAERHWPDLGPSVSVTDPEYLEQSFRHRARLRTQLARRYARLAPQDRDRAVRSHLALITAAVAASPRAVPVEQACAALRRRLDELRGARRSGPRTAPLASAGLAGDRPGVW